MMEKRNFVTSARTPMRGAKDVDDILESCAPAFGNRCKRSNSFEKSASAEDEKTDVRD